MAVEIVEIPQNSNTNIGGLYQIITFFKDYWGWMLTAFIIIIIVLILYVFIKKQKEWLKQYEDSVYKSYINVYDSCLENANKEWIRKRWNPVSLWLLLIPVIGWFLIPFIKKDFSATIRDYDGRFKGYYRGHTQLSDGMTALMYYSKKEFIFFEKIQLLKIPTKIDHITEDRRGNKINKTENIDSYFINPLNGDWRIKAVDFVKKGSYFFFPVLISNSGVIDLDSTLVSNLRKETNWNVIEDMTGDFSTAMRKAVNINASVKVEQEKVDPAKTGDNDV